MSTTIVCGFQCALEHVKKANKRREATVKLLERKQTREAWLNTQPKRYWLKEAQKWFNKFIRMRDENNPCISSSEARKCSRQRHAGHYRSVGSAPHLRFDERNCHGQCAQCNSVYSGNLIAYRAGLIAKIGVGEVEALEANNTPKHYTIDDIKELIKHYKQKCKDLEQ